MLNPDIQYQAQRTLVITKTFKMVPTAYMSRAQYKQLEQGDCLGPKLITMHSQDSQRKIMYEMVGCLKDV